MNRKTIPIVLLVADKDKSEAEIINSRMRSMGLTVHTHFCSENDDITELIEKHNPDVIILRHNLPGLHVKDLDSFISTWYTELPIILLHAPNEKLDITTYTDAGAEYLVADENFERLKQTIGKAGKLAQMSKRLQELEHKYQESEIRCNSLLDSSRDAIAYIHEGMHVYANESYLELFGYKSFDDLEGLPMMDMVVSEKQNALKDFLRQLNLETGSSEFQVNLVTAGKKVVNSNLEFSQASIDGEPCAQVIIRNKSVDEEAARELEAKISRMAKFDSNTGLLHRSAFMTQLQQSINNLAKQKIEYAYFHIGLNQFQEQNKILGPLGSDKLIKKIATTMQQVLGKSLVACYYGGKFFSYLCPIQNRGSDIEKRATLLNNAVAKINLEIDGNKVEKLNFNIGVSIIDDASLQVQEVIGRATSAFNELEKSGFAIYKPAEGEMSQNQIDKAWTDKLQQALKQQRFSLVFQPLIRLTGHDIERYEVLVRMKDNNGENISPAEFLPAADRTGFSKQIDRFVINSAFKHLVDKFKTGGKAVIVIKLTSSSLKDKNLFVWIKDRIKATGLPKNCVIFEVKADSILEADKQAAAFAAGLSAIGCGFAIDEMKPELKVGSILNNVTHQFIKFDGSLTTDLFDNQESQEFITMINNVAHKSNRMTILQQIEDPRTLSVAYSTSCDLAQGHFLSAPLPTMNFNFESAMG